jgi:kinesin family protein 4/21/27
MLFIDMSVVYLYQEIARNIHTSPALFSLERVMQGFRARSQLLVSRLEESDDVLQPHFSDDEVFEDDLDGEMEGKINGDNHKEK